jgi:hypothetical protein
MPEEQPKRTDKRMALLILIPVVVVLLFVCIIVASLGWAIFSPS